MHQIRLARRYLHWQADVASYSCSVYYPIASDYWPVRLLGRCVEWYDAFDSMRISEQRPEWDISVVWVQVGGAYATHSKGTSPTTNCAGFKARSNIVACCLYSSKWTPRRHQCPELEPRMVRLANSHPFQASETSNERPRSDGVVRNTLSN
jgi:hypothetical protein